jgi:transposase
MKKDNKKETLKSKREAKKVESLQSLEGLAERDAMSLVIGMDLGDRTSAYCVRTVGQEIILEGTVATKMEAILDAFKSLRRQRVVIETGTHSRWIA